GGSSGSYRAGRAGVTLRSRRTLRAGVVGLGWGGNADVGNRWFVDYARRRCPWARHSASAHPVEGCGGAIDKGGTGRQKDRRNRSHRFPRTCLLSNKLRWRRTVTLVSLRCRALEKNCTSVIRDKYFRQSGSASGSTVVGKPAYT